MIKVKQQYHTFILRARHAGYKLTNINQISNGDHKVRFEVDNQQVSVEEKLVGAKLDYEPV